MFTGQFQLAFSWASWAFRLSWQPERWKSGIGMSYKAAFVCGASTKTSSPRLCFASMLLLLPGLQYFHINQNNLRFIRTLVYSVNPWIYQWDSIFPLTSKWTSFAPSCLLYTVCSSTISLMISGSRSTSTFPWKHSLIKDFVKPLSLLWLTDKGRLPQVPPTPQHHLQELDLFIHHITLLL